MNKKKVVIILVILIVLVGFGVIIFNVINSNKVDNDVMGDIKVSYSTIEKDIKSYNEVRSDLIKVMDSYYSSNLENDYNNFINNLNKEEKLLDSISKEVKKLDKLCLDRLFKDKEVNNICNDYKTYYETVSNVYMNDINKVNGFINNYNNDYSKNLGIYTSSLVTEYIDYNGDGVYLEREDNNE